MLVFIDESGDPGMKLSGSSSRHFIVTLLAFEDNEEALAADQRIRLLKRELGFPAHSSSISTSCGPTTGRRS